MISKMPVTRAGLRQYDDLPAAEAVLKAWTEAGSHPPAHRHAQNIVRDSMPVLYRALERLAEEQNNGH